VTPRQMRSLPGEAEADPPILHPTPKPDALPVKPPLEPAPIPFRGVPQLKAPDLEGDEVSLVQKAKSSTLPSGSASKTAGARARRSSPPAPAVRMPADLRVSRVSRSPEAPQSITWLLVGTQVSIPAATSAPVFPGCAIVDPLGSVVLAQRDAGLEVDDPKGGSHLLQHLAGRPRGRIWSIPRPVITSPERKSFIGWVMVVGGCAVDMENWDPERWAGHPGFRQVTSFWGKTVPYPTPLPLSLGVLRRGYGADPCSGSMSPSPSSPWSGIPHWPGIFSNGCAKGEPRWSRDGSPR